MCSYKSVKTKGEYSEIVEKSQFIGFCIPISCENDAIEFIAESRKKYKDSTHVVSAYVVGKNDDVQRYNEDGEPQGTAGLPILTMIKNENIKNIAIVVVRYFGGTKLGTGGLVRAYTHVAKGALLNAVIGEVKTYGFFDLTVEYNLHGKIMNYIENNECINDLNTEFTHMVKINVKCDIGCMDKIMSDLINLTSGSAILGESHIEEGF